MTTLDPSALHAISGGQVQSRRATREQLDTFNRCSAQSDDKSFFKPWTWSRPGPMGCLKNLLDSTQQNPPEVAR